MCFLPGIALLVSSKAVSASNSQASSPNVKPMSDVFKIKNERMLRSVVQANEVDDEERVKNSDFVETLDELKESLLPRASSSKMMEEQQVAQIAEYKTMLTHFEKYTEKDVKRPEMWKTIAYYYAEHYVNPFILELRTDWKDLYPEFWLVYELAWKDKNPYWVREERPACIQALDCRS